MPLLVVKVGCNEPPTYPKHNELFHHMDIIEINREDKMSMGYMGDKQFFALNFSWSPQLQEEEKALIRRTVKEPWYANLVDDTPLTNEQLEALKATMGPDDDELPYRMISPRLYHVDLARIPDNIMNPNRRALVELYASYVEQGLDFDMTGDGVNPLEITIPWRNLREFVINKHTQQTIEDVLGI